MDIVERLRHVSKQRAVTFRPTMEDEAADEIERLRAELAARPPTQVIMPPGMGAGDPNALR